MKYRALKIEPNDNVAVVIQDVYEGDAVDIQNNEIIEAKEFIKQGHKIAIKDIQEGAMVIKYGVPIGKAKKNIYCGEHIHTNNLLDITEQLCEEYARKYRMGRQK